MDKNAKELLEGYKEGTLTSKEKLLVEDWFMKHGEGDTTPIDEAGVDLAKAEMWDVIDARRNKTKIVNLWPRIAAVAAMAMLILSAGLFYLFKTSQKNSVAQTYTLNDFAPGTNRATLKLGNGKVIALSDHKTGVAIGESKLVYNDGTDVASEISSPNANNQLTASTPRGGTYQLKLPDGTKVWLNSATELTFPSTFSGSDNRTVELSGEAYFEVTKDASHPFIVKSDRQQIQVLGTHFNVDAYPDENHDKTVLLEGSVRINNKKVLVPGQMSTVSSNGDIKIETADIDEAMAWKNGYFSFKDAPLETIMKQLSRWYNIDIVYKGEPKDDTFNGLINRNANLTRALKILDEGGVHFSLQGKTLVITP